MMHALLQYVQLDPWVTWNKKLSLTEGSIPYASSQNNFTSQVTNPQNPLELTWCWNGLFESNGRCYTNDAACCYGDCSLDIIQLPTATDAQTEANARDIRSINVRSYLQHRQNKLPVTFPQRAKVRQCLHCKYVVFSIVLRTRTVHPQCTLLFRRDPLTKNTCSNMHEWLSCAVLVSWRTVLPGPICNCEAFSWCLNVLGPIEQTMGRAKKENRPCLWKP